MNIILKNILLQLFIYSLFNFNLALICDEGTYWNESI